MRAERIVVDTNVLISTALKPAGAPRAVVDTIRHASLNMFGDAVRDLLDPRLRGR